MIDPSQEPTIRLVVFAGVLIVLGLIELILPRRPLAGVKRHRWFTNLGLVALDSLVLRILFPVLAVGFAGLTTQYGWGLFNLVEWPWIVEIIAAVVLLDLAIYGQHVASHKIAILWALHKVHHADRDVDVTTGIRFHPIEIVLSMLYKFAVIALLGPAAFAVFVFEVLLNASAMFTHANFRIPPRLDAIIRLIFVTPDMHRVHHSIDIHETDSNYGFNLSVWDRLFRTYIEQPGKGHEGMTIGLSGYQTHEPSNIWFALKVPFSKRRADEDSRK